MKKVAIIGPGALGLLFAARLGRAGIDVTLIDHRPERAALINAGGITLEEGERTSTIPVKAVVGGADAGSFDLLLVTLKAPATEGALDSMAQHVGERSKVLTLQNGVGSAELLSSRFGSDRVLTGVTSEGATRLGEVKVRHGGHGVTLIGTSGQKGPPAPEVVALFNEANFEATWEDQIDLAVWKKLAANCGINALTALLGVKNLHIATDPNAAALASEAVRETFHVAKGAGIDLGAGEELVRWVLEVAKKTGANRSSMGQDVDRRNQTEVDFINGAVVKRAKALGLNTPINQLLTTLIKSLEASYR